MAGVSAIPATREALRGRHVLGVPSRDLRERIRARAEAVAESLRGAGSLERRELEAAASSLLAEAGLPGEFLGWTMVAAASAYWRPAVTQLSRWQRLFVLPAPGSGGAAVPSSHRPTGRTAAELLDFAAAAEAAGFQVLMAEGFEQVAERVLTSGVEAIVGVADLAALEQAFEQALPTGMPCMAVPLVDVGGQWQVLDPDWAEELLHLPAREDGPAPAAPRQAIAELFRPETLAEFLPEADARGSAAFTPLHDTRRIAHEFLQRGGKHSRPFITLAVYQALGGRIDERAPTALDAWPAGVLSTALAIETFHKASLVHDDIEDDDAFRYGEPTLHRRYGTAAAINLGDYLIGLGYRLISGRRSQIGADVTADILDALAEAHLRLAEGQGAELFWRESADKRITPDDALAIYALKTAPAFEAALLSGCRLAGAAPAQLVASLRRFAHHLGVAFQIVNDLDDWRVDCRNKRRSGGDVLAGRPTVLWALALHGLDPQASARLLALVGADGAALDSERRIAEVAELYEQSQAFRAARELVARHRAAAERSADEVEPLQLRRLLLRLVQWVLHQVPLSQGQRRPGG